MISFSKMTKKLLCVLPFLSQAAGQTTPCDAAEYLGETIQFQLPTQGVINCLQVQLFPGGKVQRDSSNDCSAPFSADFTASDFDRVDGDTFYFDPFGKSPYSVEARVVNNPSAPSPYRVTKNFNGNTLEIEIQFPTACRSTPSNSPSDEASPSPSAFISVAPTLLLSSLPSVESSAEPSVESSAEPSVVTSLAPSSVPTCLADEFLGKAYYGTATLPQLGNVCVKAELFSGGKLWADVGNSDCSSPFEDDRSLLTFGGASGNMVTLTPPGLSAGGEIVILQDPALTAYTLEVTTATAAAINVILTFPSCIAPSTVPSSAPSTVPSLAPSAVPSSMPSTDPSSAPSTVPSLMPSLMPSFMPSLSPSAVPSSSPSAAPIVSSSASPTEAATCRALDFNGQSVTDDVQLGSNTFCVQIELKPSGTVSAQNGPCQATFTPDFTFAVLGGAPDGDTIPYVPGSGGDYRGIVKIVKNEAKRSPTINVVDFDPSVKSFQFDVEVSNC